MRVGFRLLRGGFMRLRGGFRRLYGRLGKVVVWAAFSHQTSCCLSGLVGFAHVQRTLSSTGIMLEECFPSWEGATVSRSELDRVPYCQRQPILLAAGPAFGPAATLGLKSPSVALAENPCPVTINARRCVSKRPSRDCPQAVGPILCKVLRRGVPCF